MWRYLSAYWPGAAVHTFNASGLGTNNNNSDSLCSLYCSLRPGAGTHSELQELEQTLLQAVRAHLLYICPAATCSGVAGSDDVANVKAAPNADMKQQVYLKYVSFFRAVQEFAR